MEEKRINFDYWRNLLKVIVMFLYAVNDFILGFLWKETKNILINNCKIYDQNVNRLMRKFTKFFPSQNLTDTTAKTAVAG